MHILLEDHPCYKEMDPIDVEDPEGQGRMSSMQNPKGVVLDKCAIAPRQDLQVRVAVEAFFDTGTDITIVREERFSEIEDQWPFDPPVSRVFFGEKSYPAFDLAFLFPGGEDYSSDNGFIVPEKIDWEKEFGLADVWLGRDVLNQLLVTFHGPDGNVTIQDPKRS